MITCQICGKEIEQDEGVFDGESYTCFCCLEELKQNYKCPNIYPRHRLGIKLSKETKKKISEANKDKKRREKNGMWKGDEVGYGALHIWITSNKPKPEFCEECGIKKPYDLANISGKYKRDINDFEWLCRSCHMKKDGRIKKLNILNKTRRRRKMSETLSFYRKCIRRHDCGADYDGVGDCIIGYEEEDVKEFIRKLKVGLKELFEEGNTSNKFVDKLAGEDLI